MRARVARPRIERVSCRRAAAATLLTASKNRNRISLAAHGKSSEPLDDFLDALGGMPNDLVRKNPASSSSSVCLSSIRLSALA